jgi:hypothetical protein
VNVVMQGSNRLMVMSFLQWISEVMHFCAGLPIILVGCKKDLRRDPRVIEELRKTSQRPVTPEEVSETHPPPSLSEVVYATANPTSYRGWPSLRRLVLSTTWNAQLERVKVFVRCSSTPPGQPFLAGLDARRSIIVSCCKLYFLSRRDSIVTLFT